MTSCLGTKPHYPESNSALFPFLFLEQDAYTWKRGGCSLSRNAHKACEQLLLLKRMHFFFKLAVKDRQTNNSKVWFQFLQLLEVSELCISLINSRDCGQLLTKSCALQSTLIAEEVNTKPATRATPCV